ncbi:unnamed protein product [Rhizoctonia solani]|uniref:Uncharacterized protein n=1 Tax=Rhizoctonia solani TaxID=456999 RepID=A0A8H3GUS1_9AGAM|nr:unnamed protein product [Rhizoctonia solani]
MRIRGNPTHATHVHRRPTDSPRGAGSLSARYMTIKEFKRRLDEQVSRMLAQLYAFGIITSLFMMGAKKLLELQEVLGRSRRSNRVQSKHSDLVISINIYTHIDPECLKGAVTEEHKWRESYEGKRTFDSMVTYINTSTSDPILPGTFTSTLGPVPDSPLVKLLLLPGPSRRSLLSGKIIIQRPSGPRFKSAAWKRCRVK